MFSSVISRFSQRLCPPFVRVGHIYYKHSEIDGSGNTTDRRYCRTKEPNSNIIHNYVNECIHGSEDRLCKQFLPEFSHNIALSLQYTVSACVIDFRDMILQIICNE